jgi:hypothetical protein
VSCLLNTLLAGAMNWALRGSTYNELIDRTKKMNNDLFMDLKFREDKSKKIFRINNKVQGNDGTMVMIKLRRRRGE